MGPSTLPEGFYLYLWRSPNAPGTLYLAKGFETAETLCRGLTEDGYIVKVVHMASDTEFELCEGSLKPTPVSPSQGLRGRGIRTAESNRDSHQQAESELKTMSSRLR
jgi:hypothetical protein